MEILPFGDHAILINFEQKIDPLINNEVISLSQIIQKANYKGIKYFIPAYCSLTVVFDPYKTSYNELKFFIEDLNLDTEVNQDSEPSTFNIPVCYEKLHAPDLRTFAKSKDKSVEEIVNKHTATTYQVYMLGFLPGFAYMGKSDELLAAKRLSSPRLKVPKGSVGLAGLQTAIYPSESPGGWQLIGQTPIEVFNPRNVNPFLFKTGDHIKFKSISTDEYASIQDEVIKNNFEINSLIDVEE